MRLAAVICSAGLISFLTVGPATATVGHAQSGTLVGHTQINTGCPGPVPVSGCNQWRPYPGATVTITRLNSAGRQIKGTTRTVRSNSKATFRLSLPVGKYLVKPTAGDKTKGGNSLRLRIAARAITESNIRFTAKTVPS